MSNNNTYEEAHIHLPQETYLLPNFNYIPFKKLLDFQDTPLKTNCSSTRFKIPSPLRCQKSLSSTLPPIPELSISTTYTNNNTSSPEISNTIQSIKIHSLNINGLLDNFKQLSLIDLISENQIDIFGISETHLSTKEAKFSTLSQKLTNYKCFWTPSNVRQGGVGIIIHKSLAKHIGKIQIYKNFILEIDIFLKNLHIKLIQLYFPTQEKKQLRKDILSYLTPILNKDNFKTLLMGDLNGVPNPKLDRLPPKN